MTRFLFKLKRRLRALFRKSELERELEDELRFHLEKEIGSLEVGKRADIVIIERDSLHQIPLYNVYSDLVYATKANDVHTVIINGRIVMRNRRLLTLNETAIKASARTFREKIAQSLSLPATP